MTRVELKLNRLCDSSVANILTMTTEERMNWFYSSCSPGLHRDPLPLVDPAEVKRKTSQNVQGKKNKPVPQKVTVELWENI